MKLGLNLIESDQKISTLILQQLKIGLSETFRMSIQDITRELKMLIADALRNQPEYASLMAGTLKAEFGLPSSDMVDMTINEMVETLTVTSQPIKISSSQLIGGFILTMIKSDDAGGVVYSDSANVQTSDGSLAWLKWLLLEGNSDIVKGYDVVYGPYSQSRSGMAIMVSSNNNWRVPNNFIGTQNNNWTTRAIDSVEKSIYDIIKRNIQNNFK